MTSNRSRSIAAVSTAAVLAGLGGVALGVAIHAADQPKSAAPVQTTTTPAHNVIPQYAGTVKMTITNNTDETQSELAPGSTETIWVIQSAVDQSAPNMVAVYALMPGLLTSVS